MKTSITSLSSKILLALTGALLSFGVQAKLVGKVHSLKGEAFAVKDGKTMSVKVDMDIEEGTGFLIDDGSSLTVGDFFDHRYNVNGGSHIEMGANSMVLKKGALWMQSLGSKNDVTVSTANLLIAPDKGEFILTYQPDTKRSQLSILTGEVDVASPAEPAFKYALLAGQFTLAQPDLDEGYPRTPTSLGHESLLKAVAMFPGVKSLDTGLNGAVADKSKRAPASVNAENSVKPKGEIIFMKSQESSRSPASLSGEAQKYFLNKVKVKAPKNSKKNIVIAPVRVFLPENTAKKINNTKRIPASQTKVLSAQKQDMKNSDFLKSIEQKRQEQPLRTPEVQRLVDELKSFE